MKTVDSLHLTDRRDDTRDDAARVYSQIRLAIWMLDRVRGYGDEQTKEIQSAFARLNEAASHMANLVDLREGIE